MAGGVGTGLEATAGDVGAACDAAATVGWAAAAGAVVGGAAGAVVGCGASGGLQAINMLTTSNSAESRKKRMPNLPF
jgi:hypothetical protein